MGIKTSGGQEMDGNLTPKGKPGMINTRQSPGSSKDIKTSVKVNRGGTDYFVGSNTSAKNPIKSTGGYR